MKRRTFIGLLSSLAIPTVSVGKSVMENKITPPTEEEDFYQFFLNFNGFPINENQKFMYKGYREKWNYLTFDRRMGVSTFLLTLAAWESFKGKRVVHFSSNKHLSDIIRRTYDDKIYEKFEGKSPDNIDFVNINRNTFPLKGLRYEVGLYDESGSDIYHPNWSHLYPLFENSICIKTTEL